MKLASARQIAGTRRSFDIEGLDNPVEIIGLSGVGVEALSAIQQQQNLSPIRLYAWLIKQCCPAFRWWSMKKICRKVPVAVAKRIADKIMEASALDAGAMERAKKKSVATPLTDSS